VLKAYVLVAPWELFDRPSKAGGVGRRPLSVEEPVLVPAGRPIYLAAPEGAKVDVEGDRLGAQRESKAFDLGHPPYTLYSLSIGTREADATMTIRLDDTVAGSIRITDHLPRPSWSLGRKGSAPSDAQQGRLDLFLLGLIDLIRRADDDDFALPDADVASRDANDPTPAWDESGWQRLTNAWTKTKVRLSDPPLALIVRHSNDLPRLLAELGHHPRRILSRTRAMTPVDRVQQLDNSSVRWLSRRPGRIVYERADSRQRIRAVQRFEDLDTLENRVLRDLAIRSHVLAESYTAQYQALKKSRRWKQVDRYRRGCRRLARDLGDEKIGTLRPPTVPNYPLLQERRYRRVWRAHREIIKKLDEQDECWRWQHRLWADFCRLAVQVALRTKFNIIAESPLNLAAEQRRGHWALVDAHSGSFLLKNTLGEPAAVMSLIWDLAADHGKRHQWMSSLGAAAVLHLQRLDNGHESYLVLWPVHRFGEDAPDSNEFAASGQRALTKRLVRMADEEDIDVRARSLVLVSNFASEDRATTRDGNVVVQRLNAGHNSMKSEIERLARTLESMARQLTNTEEI
jgi:hypothetical protein